MQTVIHTLFGNVPTVAWKLEDKVPQELKPCPFCGDDNSLQVEHDDIHWCFVFCENCLAHGPRIDDREQAIKEWNERT
jgi:Lar family restriction alleviation protein